MAENIFSFPPDKNFDDQWRAALGYIQDLEIKGCLKAIEVYNNYLDLYEQRLRDCDPLYTEQADRISELASLAIRASS